MNTIANNNNRRSSDVARTRSDNKPLTGKPSAADGSASKRPNPKPKPLAAERSNTPSGTVLPWVERAERFKKEIAVKREADVIPRGRPSKCARSFVEEPICLDSDDNGRDAYNIKAERCDTTGDERAITDDDDEDEDNQ